MHNKLNMDLLQKIAKLGSLGYVPTVEIPAVVATTNAPDSEISHLRPRTVLVTEDGQSHIDARIMHELEQDLNALISACGIKSDGRPLHELVPFAAERIGFIEERMKKLESIVRKEVAIEDIELDLDDD